MAATPQERFWVLVEELASPATLDVLDRLPGADLKTLYLGWELAAGVTLGELFKLAKILEVQRHREALEADLIDKGLRLRHCPTVDFTWHDLSVFIRHVPVTANLFRAINPDQAGWTLEAFLLADQADALHWLMWSKTKDGSRGRNRPNRIPRPGVSQPAKAGSKPKPAPLSVVKKRMAALHAPEPAAVHAKKLNAVFGGG